MIQPVEVGPELRSELGPVEEVSYEGIRRAQFPVTL